MRIVDSFREAVRSAARYNAEVQVAPVCILWPDKSRQWEEVIPLLLVEIPELLVRGKYAPENRTGPAIWLRCAIAGQIEGLLSFNENTPIIYLPGFSRSDLRAVENCPEELKPLAELQYRGVIWSQKNAQDWTIHAFLKCEQYGLCLNVAGDQGTAQALRAALKRLLEEEVENLKGKHLDEHFFNTLLIGGDPIRDLLRWFDDEKAFRSERSEAEWAAFVKLCSSQLAFNPANEGVLTGAAKLACHEGVWQAVWERFREAPQRYPNIPILMRKCKVPSDLPLFPEGENIGDWPQLNDSEENDLRQCLRELMNLPPHHAREELKRLEKRHGIRRSLVWAELGESSLAFAVEHLAVLAEKTTNTLAAGTIDDIRAGYQNGGWLCDNAVLSALASVEKAPDYEAVTTAIRSVYLPWAESAARHLQNITATNGYPRKLSKDHSVADFGTGLCLLFVDGLRYDTAKRLGKMLSRKGYHVAETISWAALPTVTATGKPAVSPVKGKIAGHEAVEDFEPCLAATGQSLAGGHHFRKQLEADGWQIVGKSETCNTDGRAWCEYGNIDHEGHERGAKLAKYLESILGEILNRIEQLFESGWQTIRVVTDHGWLLMPGGLEKIELPSCLAHQKWGRCAILKPGADANARLYSWYWNPEKSVAVADGIGCYRAGEEYAHGGLSVQECLTLQLDITKEAAHSSQTPLQITDVSWKQMRCTVAVAGDFTRLSLDIRLQPANEASSVVVGVKLLKTNGTASVVVENEDLEGKSATVVLLDERGKLVAQSDTVIGGHAK